MKSAPVEDYPLSLPKGGIPVVVLKQRGMCFDIEQFDCVMNEDVQVPLMERAWQCVVSQHAVLHTSFVWEGPSRPNQRPEVASEFNIHYEDLDDFRRQRAGCPTSGLRLFKSATRL